MADGNGDRDARLDRIERAMEMFVADHEQFREEHRELMRVQVLQNEAIEKLLKVTREQTRQMETEAEARKSGDTKLDERIESLVSAIGNLIKRIPPESLR